jgi:Fe-S cluster assembly ATP-binding protein
MGPNGSGKSTLAYSLAGHPHYKIANSSKVLIDRKNLLLMSPDKRAKAGLFLAFQYPVAIEGVTVSNFLRQAYKAVHPNDRLPPFKFKKLLENTALELGVDKSFLSRYLNDGFSGGEKKRIEIMQMRVLAPKYAICDETDSGLDVDALKTVAQGIAKSVKQTNMGCIVITHYQRILRYLEPHFVHIMSEGKIVKSGNISLVHQIERDGYKKLLK